MLKKILSNTIVRLILAVLIGLLVGLVVNEPVYGFPDSRIECHGGE